MNLTVKQRIYNVLMENKNGELSFEQIAERAYGDAFLRETKKHLIGLIKRSVSHAIAMLAEDGFIVVRVLQKLSRIDKEKRDYKGNYKKEIVGFKIADKEDIDMVEANLIRRSERLESAEQLKLSFESLARDKHLLI